MRHTSRYNRLHALKACSSTHPPTLLHAGHTYANTLSLPCIALRRTAQEHALACRRHTVRNQQAMAHWQQVVFVQQGEDGQVRYLQPRLSIAPPVRSKQRADQVHVRVMRPGGRTSSRKTTCIHTSCTPSVNQKTHSPTHSPTE